MRLVIRATPRSGAPQLYLRSLAGRAFAPIPGSENAGVEPFWSPDSQWIAFGAGGKLLKWNVTGGQPPQPICTADADFGSWGDGGVILFSEQNKPIQQVAAMGGMPRNALELDAALGEQAQLSPFFLSGGKAFLFASNGTVRGTHFFATLDGRVRRRLPDNLNGPNRWVASASGNGFLAYVNQNQLFVRPFNSSNGEFGGDAVLLVDEVVNGPTFSFGGASELVYWPRRTASTQLQWYGQDGKRGDALSEPGTLGIPQLSTDGKLLLIKKQDAGKGEIWVVPASGGSGERIVSMAQNLIGAPIWTPDGRVLYSRRAETGAEVIERPADALGSDSILATIPGNTLPSVRSISTDGKVMAANAGGGGANEVSVLSRPSGQVRRASGSEGGAVALSPDGRWLAYRPHADSNASTIVVRSVPEDPNAPLPPGERQILSIAMPVLQFRWRDKNQMIILAGSTPDQRALMALPIIWTDGTPRPGVLHKLFDVPKAANFDATADGKRFIVAETLGDSASVPMVLIQNWPALLQK
jgi:Tol biopolymer transport system component